MSTIALSKNYSYYAWKNRNCTAAVGIRGIFRPILLLLYGMEDFRLPHHYIGANVGRSNGCYISPQFVDRSAPPTMVSPGAGGERMCGCLRS
jgi:hypothetical protein